MPDDDTYRHLLRAAEKFAAARAGRTITQASVQRHVRVGFATAGLLLHGLEDAGVIGPADSQGRHPVPEARKDEDRA